MKVEPRGLPHILHYVETLVHDAKEIAGELSAHLTSGRPETIAALHRIQRVLHDLSTAMTLELGRMTPVMRAKIAASNN